jgi:hypothetical protein
MVIRIGRAAKAKSVGKATGEQPAPADPVEAILKSTALLAGATPTPPQP